MSQLSRALFIDCLKPALAIFASDSLHLKAYRELLARFVPADRLARCIVTPQGRAFLRAGINLPSGRDWLRITDADWEWVVYEIGLRAISANSRDRAHWEEVISKMKSVRDDALMDPESFDWEDAFRTAFKASANSSRSDKDFDLDELVSEVRERSVIYISESDILRWAFTAELMQFGWPAQKALSYVDQGITLRDVKSKSRRELAERRWSLVGKSEYWAAKVQSLHEEVPETLTDSSERPSSSEDDSESMVTMLGPEDMETLTDFVLTALLESEQPEYDSDFGLALAFSAHDEERLERFKGGSGAGYIRFFGQDFVRSDLVSDYAEADAQLEFDVAQPERLSTDRPIESPERFRYLGWEYVRGDLAAQFVGQEVSPERRQFAARKPELTLADHLGGNNELEEKPTLEQLEAAVKIWLMEQFEWLKLLISMAELESLGLTDRDVDFLLGQDIDYDEIKFNSEVELSEQLYNVQLPASSAAETVGEAGEQALAASSARASGAVSFGLAGSGDEVGSSLPYVGDVTGASFIARSLSHLETQPEIALFREEVKPPEPAPGAHDFGLRGDEAAARRSYFAWVEGSPEHVTKRGFVLEFRRLKAEIERIERLPICPFPIQFYDMIVVSDFHMAAGNHPSPEGIARLSPTEDFFFDEAFFRLVHHAEEERRRRRGAPYELVFNADMFDFAQVVVPDGPGRQSNPWDPWPLPPTLPEDSDKPPANPQVFVFETWQAGALRDSRSSDYRPILEQLFELIQDVFSASPVRAAKQSYENSLKQAGVGQTGRRLMSLTDVLLQDGQANQADIQFFSQPAPQPVPSREAVATWTRQEWLEWVAHKDPCETAEVRADYYFDRSAEFQAQTSGLSHTRIVAMKREEALGQLADIYTGHRTFFRGLAWFLAQGNRLVVTRGNHDPQLYWPEVQMAFVGWVKKAYVELCRACNDPSMGELPVPAEELLTWFPAVSLQEFDERIDFDHSWYYYRERLSYIVHGSQHDAPDAHRYFLLPAYHSREDGNGTRTGSRATIPEKSTTWLNALNVSPDEKEIDPPLGSVALVYVVNVLETQFPNIDRPHYTRLFLGYLSQQKFRLIPGLIRALVKTLWAWMTWAIEPQRFADSLKRIPAAVRDSVNELKKQLQGTFSSKVRVALREARRFLVNVFDWRVEKNRNKVKEYAQLSGLPLDCVSELDRSRWAYRWRNPIWRFGLFCMAALFQVVAVFFVLTGIAILVIGFIDFLLPDWSVYTYLVEHWQVSGLLRTVLEFIFPAPSRPDLGGILLGAFGASLLGLAMNWLKNYAAKAIGYGEDYLYKPAVWLADTLEKHGRSVPYIVLGHDHVRNAQHLKGGSWYLNTGSWLHKYELDRKRTLREPLEYSFVRMLDTHRVLASGPHDYMMPRAETRPKVELLRWNDDGGRIELCEVYQGLEETNVHNELELIRRFEPQLRFSKNTNDQDDSNAAAEEFFPMSAWDFVSQCQLNHRSLGSDLFSSEPLIEKLGAVPDSKEAYLVYASGILREDESMRLDDRPKIMCRKDSLKSSATASLDQATNLLSYDQPELPEAIRNRALEKYNEVGPVRWKDGHPPVYHYHITTDGSYTVLEYWFLYAYNDWAYHGGYNDHEGDWEVVYVYLDEKFRPQHVAYSRHVKVPMFLEPERRKWSSLRPVGQNQTHPVVHVGLGSHASYANADTHNFAGFTDYHYGNATRIGPDSGQDWGQPIRISNKPWNTFFQGNWGALGKSWVYDTLAGARGPIGPAQQGGKWDRPARWARLPRR